ncbi:MAG: AAA family ATPase [Candidatus Eisenbacteria bacterium]|nr:AAA family ATPase [Candidatus Eisenbacteria bacterium]
MRPVRFLSLRLEGFGLYDRPVEFTFPAGLAVDVRPNEKGKSTAIDGLLAVLYGLPHTTDPERFGSERCRSWEPARSFSGVLELSVDGRRFRIHRDFETHATRIVAEEGADPVLFDGEANPMGRTYGIRRYRETLSGLITVTDEDLFRSIFSLGQPLPSERQIPHEVQRLLTGTGEAAGARVLSILFQSFKELSRKTGEAGIHEPGKRPTDQRTDGRLEELQARLAELEANRDQTEGQFARLKETEQRVQKLTEDRGRNSVRREEIQSVLQRIEEYRRHATEIERLGQWRSQLRRARDSVTQNETERAQAEAELQERFPRLAAAPESLGSAIADAVAAHSRLEASREKVHESVAEKEAVRGDLEQVEAALAEEPALRNRPEDFFATLRRRAEIAEHAETLRNERDGLQTEWERLQSADTADAPWEKLPQPAAPWLERLAAQSRTLLGQLREWRMLMRESRTLRSDLSRWAILDEPDAPSVDEISRADDEWRRLEEEAETLEQQETLEEERAVRIHNTYRRQAAWRRVFEALGGAAAGAAVALTVWVLQLVPGLVAAGLGFMAAIGITVILWRHPASHAAVSEALQATMENTRRRRQDAEQRRLRFLERTQPILSALDLPGPEKGGLAALAQEVQAWRAARARLGTVEERRRHAERTLFGRVLTETNPADAEAETPPPSQASSGSAEAGETDTPLPAQADLEAAESMDAAETAAPVPSGSESAESSGTAKAGKGDEASSDPEAILDTLSPGELPSPLPELVLLAAEINNRPVAGVEGLLSWLEELPPERWESWTQEARDWTARRERMRELRTRIDLLEGKAGERGLQHLEHSLVQLDAACEPFARDEDLDRLQSRWEKVRGLEERSRQLQDHLRRADSELEELRRREAEAARAWEPLQEPLAEELAAAGGDARTLETHWQEAQRLRKRMEEAARLRDQALAIPGDVGSDLESLERALEDANERWGYHYRAREDLVEESDTVRAYVAMDSPERRDGYRQDLRAEEEELAAKETQLAEGLTSARVELRSLRAAQGTDLAAAELEIRDLREQIARLERRRDVIHTAWRLVKAAVEDIPRSFGPALAEEMTGLLARVSRKDDRRVILNSDLELGVIDNDHRCSLAQLSQGARDQLTLALRVALARQIARDVILPLLLDDPFVNFDRERLGRAAEALGELAKDRQILVWSQDERLRDWGPPIQSKTLPA